MVKFVKEFKFLLPGVKGSMRRDCTVQVFAVILFVKEYTLGSSKLVKMDKQLFDKEMIESVEEDRF